MANSLHTTWHKGLQGRLCLANPPFNVRDWAVEHVREEPLAHGAPSIGNANSPGSAHHPPSRRRVETAGGVLANASCPSQQSNRGSLPKHMIGRISRLHGGLPGSFLRPRSIRYALGLARDKKSGFGRAGQEAEHIECTRTLFIRRAQARHPDRRVASRVTEADTRKNRGQVPQVAVAPRRSTRTCPAFL